MLLKQSGYNMKKLSANQQSVINLPYLAAVYPSLDVSGAHLVVSDSAVQVGRTIADLVLDHRETSFLQDALTPGACDRPLLVSRPRYRHLILYIITALLRLRNCGNVSCYKPGMPGDLQAGWFWSI